MLTTNEAYELGFAHGSEMARESGSADAGPDGWDGLLINADPKFARESLGWQSGSGEVMAAYVSGAQAGANAAVTAE